MLFKVTDRPLIEDNPGIVSVPEFRDVPDRILKYIFLVHDFESPYRLIPSAKRKEKCVILAGFKMEPDGKRLDKNAREAIAGTPQITALTKVFMELQEDDEKESLVSLREMIEDCNALLRKKNKNEKEMALALKVSDGLIEMTKNKRELEELIKSRGMIISEDSGSDVSDKPISRLDQVNSENQD